MSNLEMASTYEFTHEVRGVRETEERSVLKTLWSVVTADPGTGVAVIRSDGRFLFMNEASRLFWTPSGEPTMEWEGRTVYQNVPLEFADHVMGVIRKVTEQHKTVVDRTIWRGKQLMTTVRFLEPPSGELPRIIAVTRHTPGATQPIEHVTDVEVIESSVADLGPLDVLTTRELEVLALVGQGLRISDIARVLVRSRKTIETHRLSVGRKLFPRGTNRVELAKLVFDAGLRLDDAKLQRIKPKSPEQP